VVCKNPNNQSYNLLMDFLEQNFRISDFEILWAKVIFLTFNGIETKKNILTNTN